MKAYILVMTFFLANGQPVQTIYEPAVYEDKVTPVYDLTDCHEIATDKRRKFFESIRGQNNLFMDLAVECKNKNNFLLTETRELGKSKSTNKEGNKMSKHEFKEFDKVLVRMDNVSVWTPAFFGRLDTDEKHLWRRHITTANIGWAQCISYNETTKHLIGTIDPYVDPAESPVFEFGDVVEHRVTKVRGIFSRNDPEAAEVFWKGSIVTTACDLEDLHLIRKGNFNE